MPQNGGNRVSEDLKFQNFPGEETAFHRSPSPNLDPRQQLNENLLFTWTV